MLLQKKCAGSIVRPPCAEDSYADGLCLSWRPFSFSSPDPVSPTRKTPAAVSATEFGVEGPMPRAGMNPGELPIFMDAVSHLGASFMVASFTPEWNTPLAQKRGNYIGTEGTESTYREFAALCRQRQLSFFINQQVTSYCLPGDFPDKSGHDILAHGDGTHRWDVAGPLLEQLSRMPEFRGVVYDEAE